MTMLDEIDMSKKSGLTFALLLVLFFVLLYNPQKISAADFAGELVNVIGEVIVTVKSTDQVVSATVGMKVKPGDKIETKEGAAVEILFDDGNITRMSDDTELVIEQLSIKGDKSKHSVLRLRIGKIKNSVAKLINKRSKFEIHTKSVVAGVTGTPPFIVGVFPQQGTGQPFKTEVDLLIAKGDTGRVSVRGTDPQATTVNLSPGSRTITFQGLPPIKPFTISPSRSRRLQRTMPIITPPARRDEKRQEMEERIEEVAVREPPPEETPEEAVDEEDEGETQEEGESESEGETQGEEAPEGGEEPAPGEEPQPGDLGRDAGGIVPDSGNLLDTNMMMDHITRRVSVGDIIVPSESETGESTESQIIQGERAIAGTNEEVVPSTTRVRIRVTIINP